MSAYMIISDDWLCLKKIFPWFDGWWKLVQLLNCIISGCGSFYLVQRMHQNPQTSNFMRKPVLWHMRTRYEPRHDKTNKVSVCPAKIQISLDIRPLWSESLLSAWRNLGSLSTRWAQSEDSDQTGPMPRLIGVFAGRTLILLVLS